MGNFFTFDTGSVLFWSVTYICIIVRGIKKESLLIPAISIYLNFSWELCSVLINSSWKNWLWLILDSAIFVLMVKNNIKEISEEKKSSKIIVSIVLMVLFVTVFALTMFLIKDGMLISSFVIDIIMAVGFLLLMFLFPQRGTSLPIAITKLIGDFCAWQYYRGFNKIVDIIGTIVFIINFVYLILSFAKVHHLLLKLESRKK